MIKTHNILGLEVAITSIEEASRYIEDRAVKGFRGYVCAANVHMCMEALDDPGFREVVNSSTIVVPDGKPLLWWMRSFGVREATQVRGPDLFLALCDLAEKNGVPVGLYGGSRKVVSLLLDRLKHDHPNLGVVCAISPPFRELQEAEQNKDIQEINGSGARILFVGLGCPKQEKWMSDNADRVSPIMIGVGAAFDFHAGTKKIAPKWMRASGLEWFHRFLNEPGRLWKRYLWNNPRFVFHWLAHWLDHRSHTER